MAGPDRGSPTCQSPPAPAGLPLPFAGEHLSCERSSRQVPCPEMKRPLGRGKRDVHDGRIEHDHRLSGAEDREDHPTVFWGRSSGGCNQRTGRVAHARSPRPRFERPLCARESSAA
jgi:hypothetical protein